MVYGLWIPIEDGVVFVHTTAGAEFCHFTEHHQGMNVGSRALYFLKYVGTVNTCIFFLLLWTPAQSEHDKIAFVGPYSGLAMQFSVEATLLAELSGGFLGAYKNAFSIQAVLPTYVPIVGQPLFLL